MCVPNENITELLEFCYSGPQIRIVKGKNHTTTKHILILVDLKLLNHFFLDTTDVIMLKLNINSYLETLFCNNAYFCKSMHSFAEIENDMLFQIYNELWDF